MLEKLNENSHKPDWNKLCLRELLEGINEEVSELQAEYTDGKIIDIRREAADVANYAAMIIKFCDNRIKEMKQIKGLPGMPMATGNKYGGGYGD
jgi:NTP pyrophosphatase (non-canonical NTP hydrolase)